MTMTFSELLPPLSTDEFASLRSSIKAEGVRVPIVVDEAGNVLDGRHRLKCDKNAPRKIVKGLSEAEKQAFVFQSNLARRNLSPSQKKDAAKTMKAVAKALRTENPKKNTQARVAMLLGVDQKTVSRWLDVRSNRQLPNASNPDARVKIPTKEHARIVARIEAGESQAQVAADYGVSQKAISLIVKKAGKKSSRVTAARTSLLGNKNDYGIIHGDFREVAKTIPDKSVSLIFTDPPYDRKTLPSYGDLAQLASRILVPGGSLICYLGQYLIDDVCKLVTPHMRLWWTLACIHTGTSARMREYGVVVKWKPMLWFVNKTRGDKLTFVDDLIVSEMQKESHDWQQSTVEAEYYIKKLTSRGDLVFDPFCGGGTTCVAAKQSKRKWISCDIDEDAVSVARSRIKDAS